MRITNDDLDFLVELENYLGAKESWSPMVQRLWLLNDRLLNRRTEHDGRRYVRRRSDPIDRLLRSVSMRSDELDSDDTSGQSDGESAEDIVKDIIRICEVALNDMSNDDDKTPQNHTDDKPRYVVKLRLRKRDKKHK